jgi:hypothetical protein
VKSKLKMVQNAKQPDPADERRPSPRPAARIKRRRLRPPMRMPTWAESSQKHVAPLDGDQRLPAHLGRTKHA